MASTDAGSELLNGIKSMYVNTLACVRVKGIDCGVRQGCFMSSWFFYAYIDSRGDMVPHRPQAA